MAETEIIATLGSILEGRGGVFSVMARDLKTGEEVSLNPDVPLPTASVFKVPVLVELFRQAGEGRFSLSEMHALTDDDKSPGSGVLKDMSEGLRISLYDLATLMIIISDNTAADLCLHKAGVDRVNALMQELGLNNTYVAMGCKGLLAHCAGIEEKWPTREQVDRSFQILKEGLVYYETAAFQGTRENTITSTRDMVDLMQVLYEGVKLPKDVCRECLEVMKKQQLRDRIPGLLPLGTVTMTKSGTLGRNVVINDVGIVEPKDGNPYAIAILTKQEPRDDSREIPARLSKAVFDYFTGRRAAN
ncbi:MAG: serine hydrolase [Bacillota bacterium]|jgi:beta-lactamase class A|nr:serine hydrolase [Candidatus Fermentithermobacillaceae bacterium]